MSFKKHIKITTDSIKWNFGMIHAEVIVRYSNIDVLGDVNDFDVEIRSYTGGNTVCVEVMFPEDMARWAMEPKYWLSTQTGVEFRSHHKHSYIQIEMKICGDFAHDYHEIYPFGHNEFYGNISACFGVYEVDETAGKAITAVSCKKDAAKLSLKEF